MKKALFIAVLCFNVFISYSQRDTVASTYAATIKMQDLYKNLSVLASDEYEGRETGKPGLDKAADYISTQFKYNGLIAPVNGSYYQKFNVATYASTNSTLQFGKNTFPFGTEHFFYGVTKSDTLQISELLFLGYGIDDVNYSDYTNVDVKDKYLLILGGEPVKDSLSLITKNKKPSAWVFDREKKIEIAKAKGAKGIIVIPADYNRLFESIKRYVLQPTVELERKAENDFPVIYLSNKIGDEILNSQDKTITADLLKNKILKDLKSTSFAIKSDITLHVTIEKKEAVTQNVVGYIEGKELKKEVIVISAHYDHLGIKDDKIYNGADDDGSGTVSVMEIAEAFAAYKRKGFSPKRSLLFVLFSGEEKGLLGSKYYSQNPVMPLENTVCNLNIDMVGRVDSAHQMASDYIYVIGSEMLSSELKRVSEATNKVHTKLNLDYTYDDPNDVNRFYYRSDHYNFAKNNIPVIFYFNGVHKDYHQETDEISKIDFELMEKRAKLVFHTAWNIANRKERIVADKLKKN